MQITPASEIGDGDVGGWTSGNLIVDRFGLNFDFIEAQGLSWIDGPGTSGNKDLSDPTHKFYNAAYWEAKGKQLWIVDVVLDMG